MIPDSVLAQIQDRVDIVELVSAYVPLRRAGRNFKAPCPFHQEKTPSFMVSPDKQIFHCFGCGAGGNVFGFLMKIEKKDFVEAVETLAEKTGVEIPKDKAFAAASEKTSLLLKANQRALEFYHKALLGGKDSERARAYLEKRGISAETIQNFKIGWASDSWDALSRALRTEIPAAVLERAGLVIPRKEEGHYDRFRQRIIFPILDAKGICVAFGGRVLDDSLPKYLNSPETEIYTKGRHLYGLFQARKSIRERDAVIVVEGYMDLLACHQAGVTHVVASLGTALTPDQARLLKRHTQNVTILYDADKAGEMATLRGLEVFLEEGLEVKIVRLERGHDPDSFIRGFGAGKLNEALARAQTLFDYKLSLLKDRFDARSVEGKVKIAGEMVALFSKVSNEVLRAAWTKELARELSVSEEAVLAELRKAREGPRSGVRAAAPVLPEKELPSAECLLVGLLLDDLDFVRRARAEITAADFKHPVARRLVAELLMEKTEEGPGLTAAAAVNFYKDDPESAQVITLASAEAETLVDKQKAFEDCLAWVRASRMKTRREGLRSEISSAGRQGDQNRIGKLLRELDELNKGMRKTNEKK
ncbi:MAG: DNA primase [Candidatus Omnitrophica bacterium]|nr:DNA primase [Candidatus Omnitrophota bacterium]